MASSSAGQLGDESQNSLVPRNDASLEWVMLLAVWGQGKVFFVCHRTSLGIDINLL